MAERNEVEQQAYLLSFTIGFNVNLPVEAYCEADWQEMERRYAEANESGDAVDQGYLAGRLAQRECK